MPPELSSNQPIAETPAQQRGGELFQFGEPFNIHCHDPRLLMPLYQPNDAKGGNNSGSAATRPGHIRKIHASKPRSGKVATQATGSEYPAFNNI